MIPLQLCRSFSFAVLLFGFLSWTSADVGSEVPKLTTAGTDLYGDPLPPGAIARLGTARFRQAVAVTSLTYSPDGKVLASIERDESIHGEVRSEHVILWDAATGRITKRIAMKPFRAHCITFTPDGRLVAVGGTKNEDLLLREVETGKTLHRFAARHRVAAIARDGKSIACDREGIISLGNVGAGPALRTLDAADFRGYRLDALAFSFDQKTLAVNAVYDERDDSEGSIRLVDIASGREVRRFQKDCWMLHALAFSPDDKILVSAGDDRTIRVWDTGTGAELRRIETRLNFVSSLAFSPDGKVLALGGSSGSICLVDTATWKEIRPLDTHRETIWSLAFSPDAKFIISGSRDRTVRLWEARTGKPLHSSRVLEERAVHRVAFAPNGKAFVSGGDNHHCRLWHVGSNGEFQQQCVLPCRTITVVFSPDGKSLASGGIAKEPIRLWDAATGEERTQWPTERTACLAFAPDSHTLAASEPGSVIRLLDMQAGDLIHQMTAPVGAPRYGPGPEIVFSPDGRTVIAMEWGLGVRLWETASGRERRCWPHLRPRDYNSCAMAISPDGRVLATRDEDEGIRLRQVPTGKVLHSFLGHAATVQALAFSPDGRLLASSSNDATILVWDVAALKLDLRLPHARLEAKMLDKLWGDLGSADAAAAYNAVWQLAAARDQAVQLLTQRLRPAVRPIEAERLQQWIADLDADQFAVRQSAIQELQQLGEFAEPALHRALRTGPALEMRLRVEFVLRTIAKQRRQPSLARLQAIRAVETLELINTSEARSLLETLAPGAEGATVTREAKATLARLSKMPVAAP